MLRSLPRSATDAGCRLDMSSEVKLLLVVAGAAMLLMRHGGDAFSTGPPSSVCRTMMPSHRAEPSTSPSPYVVTFHRRSGHSSRRRIDGKGRYTLPVFTGRVHACAGPHYREHGPWIRTPVSNTGVILDTRLSASCSRRPVHTTREHGQY